MCWALRGSHRSNLDCSHWMPSKCCGCGLCIAACPELCVYEQWLALSVTLKWSLLYSVPISQQGLKKENDRSEINAAAKILPRRTSYCKVLWEDNWGVIGKPMVVMQVLHPWHIHVVAVSMIETERNDLHLLCRNAGKTKPCCDKRMDFREQNHWRFEDVYSWDHQLVFQVSAKRGWKWQISESAGSERAAGGRSPHSTLAKQWILILLYSRKAVNAEEMQSRSCLYGPCTWWDVQQSAGPLKVYFVYC